MPRVVDPREDTTGGNVIGRATERASIDELIADARGGRSAALLFSGPAGIGKSTLLRYAEAHAIGFRVLRTAGVESEMAFGYAGVSQLVIPALDFLDQLPEQQRAALEAVVGRGPRLALDPFMVGFAVLSLLGETARAKPVLVTVDDAQWLDEESATALSFVGRRLHSEGVAMFLAIRDTAEIGVRFGGLRRVDVAGLPDRDARQLLASATAEPIDEAVADEIVAATAGNPLALAELPGALTVEQLNGTAPLPDPLPIGPRLVRIFASRARALGADAQMVLVLSAAERMGDPMLLRAAAAEIGSMSWDTAAAEAEASRLVSFTPTVEFRHPLARSAVYYSADPAHRRLAHAALAKVLVAPADADRRAWHLGAAAIDPDEDVARALEMSAERARSRGGSSAAAVYLRRAAELTPDAGRATGRFLEAARAELTAGHAKAAQELLDRARAGCFGPQHQADAAWTQSLIHFVTGSVREAAILLADALAAIGDDGDGDVAVGASLAAAAAAMDGAHLVEESTRLAIGTAVRVLHDRGTLPSPIAGVVDGAALRLAGDTSDALPALQSGMTAVAMDQARMQEAAGRHVHIAYFDAILAAVEVLDDAAWDDLTRGWAQLSRQTGAPYALPMALSLRSWLEVLQGRPGSSASHLSEINDLVADTGSLGLLGKPSPAHVLLAAWQGDEEGTRSGARRMMQDAHERGSGAGIDHAYAALVVLEIGSGRYEAALRAAQRLCDHDCVGLGALALADLVEAATRCEQPAMAADGLDRLARRAAAAPTAWARGLLARAQALVECGDAADHLFQSSIEHLSHCTIATERARTQLLYGEWLRRARRRREARAPLRDAIELFEGMGASAFASRARAELAATGEQIRARPAPVDLLTPKEAQIVRLAAEGERNHDIAAQLYISTSTVEYHLRKVFVKLGVTSRTQLAQLELPA